MSVEERQMYEEMRELPDFDSYPIPESWYAEFKIPRNPVSTVEEFLKSGYTAKKAFERKNLPPLIIIAPQKNGKLVTVPDFQVPDVKTFTRQFDSSENFPTVLPILTEEDVFLDEFLCQKPTEEHQVPENLQLTATSICDSPSQESSSS
jgi:hypothetical protein